MTIYLRRGLKILIGLFVMVSFSGCFLFGGKKGDATLEKELKATRKGQETAIAAVAEADRAIEEGRYDSAVINFNSAIQADSSNLGLYIDLASLHQQLAVQRQDEQNLDAAIQENLRALKVLSTLVSDRLKPAAEKGIDLTYRAPVDGMAPMETPAETAPAEPPPAEPAPGAETTP